MNKISGKGRNSIRLKYTVAWHIGKALSFFLYYSGIIPLYAFFCTRVTKKPIAVILMYHSVNDHPDDRDITVSVERFKEQVEYLSRDFKVITLDEMVNIYKHGTVPESNVVAITFDDGFKDNYTEAFPVLIEYGLPATIFVATDHIGQSFGLSEDEIVSMAKKRITFGAHTVSHPVMSGLNREEAISEVTGSKNALEKILKETVHFFAYPYGKRGRDFTEESLGIVRECGFAAAFSTDNGFVNSDNDLFALKRIGMRDFELFVLKARLSGIFESRFFYFLRSIFRV